MRTRPPNILWAFAIVLWLTALWAAWWLVYERIEDRSIVSVSQPSQAAEALSVQATEQVDEFVDTEGANAPEIIVDVEAIEALPEFEGETTTVDEQQEIAEDLDIEEVDDEELPSEILLDVPFYAQAPEWNWALPWKEACEEASIVLAHAYLTQNDISLEQFKREVLELVDYQTQNFGQYIDTWVDDTKTMYDDYFDEWTTYILDDPTIDDLKRELAQWHPIVAPFAWRELWNSNFTNWWPRYHMALIIWYDDQFFYTNDVWTRRGAQFPYTYDTIMNALHDFTQEDILTWAKRVLVITP